MVEETGVEKPKFRVGPAALAVVIVSGVIAAAMAMPEAQGSRAAGEVVGKVVATVGLPLLLGWVVFRLGGRAAAGPVIVFVALAGAFASLSKKVERRKAADNVEDKLQALRDARGAEDPAARQKAADEALAALEQLGQAHGDDLKGMTQMLRKLQEPAQELDAMIDEFVTAGGVDTATLPTLAAVEARLALVGRMRVKAELVRDKAKTFATDAEAEMRAAGVDPAALEGFMRSMRENSRRLELTVELRESIVRFVVACQDMLTLLRKHFGAWRPDPDGGSFTFEEGVPAADIEAYNRAHAVLQTEAAAQGRLEQEIARASK